MVESLGMGPRAALPEPDQAQDRVSESDRQVFKLLEDATDQYLEYLKEVQTASDLANLMKGEPPAVPPRTDLPLSYDVR